MFMYDLYIFPLISTCDDMSYQATNVNILISCHNDVTLPNPR